LFQSFSALKNAALNIGQGVWEIFRFILANSNWWKLVLFFYLFYAIGSSISLSSSDIKGAFRGFIYFVVLLFFFNIATIWKGNFVLDIFSRISNYFSGFYFLIILSIGLNIVFIVILWLIGLVVSQFSSAKPSRKPKK
jgi:hypothetical protein